MSRFYYVMILVLLFAFSACHKVEENENRIDLSGYWQFQKQGDTIWYSGKVPGTVQTDLFANKLIPELYFSDNELKNKWIENKNWIYRKVFYLDENQLTKNAELVFEGLDTYAHIFLNGQRILDADNMFRSYRIETDTLLKIGENLLEIVFESPIQKATPIYDSLPYRLPADNDRNEKQTSVFTRKAPYQYGWDWGPRYVTMGIWRPVYLQFWEDFKVIENRLYQKSINDKKAVIIWNTSVYIDKDLEFSREISRGESKMELLKYHLSKGNHQLSDTFEIKNPKRWWPNGLGQPYLYAFDLKLNSKNRQVKERKKLGFRTVQLITEKDSIGESFYFKVNDVPVYAKGANYIPQDNFLPEVDSNRYKKLIKSVKEANMNMLRVWGGGIYENDLFYDLCDENGILIWQDFMFACSLYPGDSSFLHNVEYEAIENIKRVRDHASLALWCGNNEIYELWYNWGYQKKFGYSKTDSLIIWNDYQKLFNVLLPDLVNEHNLEISYWESSPKIGWGHTESMQKGDSHYWGVWWGKEPFDVYEEKVPRFSSEFGFQSLPQMSTLYSFAGSSQMHLQSADMQAHQKSSIGNQTILQYMERDFPVPENFEDFVYVSQLVQAYGVGKAIEAQRRAKPRCMGTLYWQLNDCWPGISWSGLDYFGNWKALHYEAQHDFATFLVSIDGHSVYVVSDSLNEVDATLSLQMKNFRGEMQFDKELTIEIKPNSSEKVFEFPYLTIGSYPQNQFFIEAKLFHNKKLLAQNTFYFLSPIDLILPLNAQASFEIQGNELLIWSESGRLIKNLYLESSVHLAKNFFDVLPQDTVRIPIEKHFSLSDITGFKCLNNVKDLFENSR